jgi:DNA polymerase III beta subunit, N-terminal domain
MSAVVTLAPPTSAAQTEAKMEIVVNRAALLAELTLAQGITSTKAVSPILMNILIEANDDSLTIIATNLDQSVKTSVPAKVKTPGIVTLPARKFFDYVKLLQAEEIKITALDNGWVQIRSGPVEHQDARYGSRQLPCDARARRRTALQDSGGRDAAHDRADELRRLQGGVPLYPGGRSLLRFFRQADDGCN